MYISFFFCFFIFVYVFNRPCARGGAPRAASGARSFVSREQWLSTGTGFDGRLMEVEFYFSHGTPLYTFCTVFNICEIFEPLFLSDDTFMPFEVKQCIQKNLME